MSESLENVFYTPRRAQKCLFVPDNNSRKKNTSRNLNCTEDIEIASEEESDLEPILPLALTDRSPNSRDSSSDREFVSPFATPDKSSPFRSVISLTSVINKRSEEDCVSPFSSLRKLTKAARYSPRCKIFSKSSKSLFSSPDKPIELLTPKSSSKDNKTMDEIVPETPRRSFAEIQDMNIMETPQKDRSPEYKLITPLGSITKTAFLPKLSRRKSLNVSETYNSFSPEQKENVLKRRIHDHLKISPSKLFKTDDTSVPKARAALFQEKKDKLSFQDFSLSTKTFYNSYEKIKRPLPFGKFHDNLVTARRSLPISNNYKHSLKRRRSSGINAGVFHKIKKPKLKISPVLKKKEHVIQNAVANKSPSIEQAQSRKETMIIQRVVSPEIDETKRFFKTKRTIRLNQSATVTVNNKIKLKVADGKILLNKKRNLFSKNVCTRTKAVDVAFDATDLTVDEPTIEATIAQDKVDNILKILEDDWRDDDYDTMGALTDHTNIVSPLKPSTLSKCVLMSPTSELSNMTSTMNIKDIDNTSTNFKETSFNKIENNDNQDIQKKCEGKYFPLFTKGYSVPNDIFEETNPIKFIKTAKRNMQWQLSVKGGGAENQYQLDAGQKHFGATQCSECNVVYQLGDPEDENAHLNYHNSIRILKFQGWKMERIIMEDSFTSSRIILIEPHDSKLYWRKVSEILTVVDRDLGLSDMKISDYRNKKVYLYIREKNVLGVLIAEYIKTAYRMIPEFIDLNCCTAEDTPTKCGINVVWTAISHRRQGIATKLVDTLRSKFFYGYVMSLDDIAFSIPTPSGKIFAEKYTKTRNFKVYH